MKYEIKGNPMGVVICNLDAGETMINESGSMAWMSPNMHMETTGGGIGRVLGRMFSGERLFQNHFTAEGGPGMIAFASSFPGSVRAVEIEPGKSVICQKSAFLASTSGVELSVFFNKRLGVGLFGGEGFIMQKLSGAGVAFLEIDGYAVEYDLKAGQTLMVDTGSLAMMDETVTMEVQTVRGAKNVLLGGEGLFLTALTGPGRVVLQTMPIANFAQTLIPYLPQPSESH